MAHRTKYLRSKFVSSVPYTEHLCSQADLDIQTYQQTKMANIQLSNLQACPMPSVKIFDSHPFKIIIHVKYMPSTYVCIRHLTTKYFNSTVTLRGITKQDALVKELLFIKDERDLLINGNGPKI